MGVVVEVLPPGYFRLSGRLCVRLPEGGWRVATDDDKAECQAELDRARHRLELTKEKAGAR